MRDVYTGECTICSTVWHSTCPDRLYCDACKVGGYHRIGKSTASTVLTRDGWNCQVCGKHYTDRSSLDLHHLTMGGQTNPSNLVSVCSNKLGRQSCHVKVHNIIKLTTAFLSNQAAYDLLRDTFADEREARLSGSLPANVA